MSNIGNPDIQFAAVVVTYNPPPDLESRLAALSGWVGHTWVIDNTGEQHLAADSLPLRSNLTVIRNDRNLGVAAAQNDGMMRAHERGYQWAILLDQDTTLTSDYFSVANAAIASMGVDAHVAVFAPAYQDGTAGLQRPNPDVGQSCDPSPSGPIDTAISSGSLVRVASYVTVGGMDPRLFIDYVDYDFLIRLKLARFESRALPTIIRHSVGNAKRHGLFNWNVITSNHPARRLFSAGRNLTILTQRYRKTHGELLWSFWRAELKRLLKIAVLEAHALGKIGAFVHGIVEAIQYGDTRDVGNSKYYRHT